MIFSLILNVYLIFNYVSCYNILGLFPYPAKSHYVIFDSLMVELANRGHNVTVYNSFPKDYEIQRYKEISTKECFFLPDILRIEQMLSFGNDVFLMLKIVFDFGPKEEELFSCSPIIELWNSTEKYDLLITETFVTDFFMLYSHKLNIPLITFHSNVPLPWMSARMSLGDNPSYIPHSWSGIVGKMHFMQRFKNLLDYLYSLIAYKQKSEDFYDNIARKLFGYFLPSVGEVAKNTSLMFLYNHFSLNSARPMVPNVVEVAGLNIKKPNTLSKDIEKFINESKHGVIYFCMGSLLRGDTFPEEKRDAFLYAFSQISQRVLWKWEGDLLPGKSDNVMIAKWMPQRDILAHPNVKLFISHGGLLGTTEAVYEGVPILGIPIFGDQRTNVRAIESNGAGELLDYNDITKEVVLEKIQRIINDPKYRENAKQLSDRYRDRPMSPLDTAVYWTEYVIRHKGAPHLKTAAVDLSWYQYLLLDVIAFLIFIFISIILISYYVFKIIFKITCNLVFNKKNVSKKTVEKEKKIN